MPNQAILGCHDDFMRKMAKHSVLLFDNGMRSISFILVNP